MEEIKEKAETFEWWKPLPKLSREMVVAGSEGNASSTKEFKVEVKPNLDAEETEKGLGKTMG